jgi:glycosyl transferase family 87
MSIALANEPANVNRDALQAFALLGALAFAGTALAYLTTISWVAPIPRDSTGLVVGRDFLNFWMYGRAAALPDPQRFYDPLVYARELSELLWPDYPEQNFSYPPTIMLIVAPFGRLPYMPALLAWTALGLMIFIAVARQHLSERRTLIALTLAPAALFCLMSGQVSLIAAAMLVAIFSWLDRRPVATGVLIGLLTLKPQLGLLFPVMLVAGGYWRAFVIAALTALMTALMTAALFGPQVWIDFVTIGLPVQNFVLVDPKLALEPFCPTIYMNLRGLGASFALAMTVQLVVAALAAAAVAWVFRFHRDAAPDIKMALFLACSVCVTPYLLAYDTLALCFAALMLLERDRLDAAGRRLAQLVYWLPLIQLGLGHIHVPGPALIAPAFALYLVRRIKTAR